MSKKEKDDRKPFDGVGAVAEMLKHMAPGDREKLLKNMAAKAPEVTEKIRKRISVFEDLLQLDDRELQTLLQQVPVGKLALAMRNASPELKKKILNNLPKSAGDRLLQDIDFLGPQRLSDVQLAQAEIMKLLGG